MAPGTDVLRVVTGDDGVELLCSEVLALLRDSAPFRTFFRDVLASARFESFFFEMPPMTSATLDRAFELALIDAPPLARIRPDPTDFEEHFAASGGAEVLAFPNLGKDAMLVVPCPRAPHAAYAHLGTFVRSAPPSQIDALFANLGRAVEARLSSAPLWVSTAGLGVSWLHVRLDRRPKYYRHEPYKTF